VANDKPTGECRADADRLARMFHQDFRIIEPQYGERMFFVAPASRRQLFGPPQSCKNAGETPALRKTCAAVLCIRLRLKTFYPYFYNLSLSSMAQ